MRDITYDDVFVSLGMSGIDTMEVEKILKENPNEAILAGGSIANSILNVESGTLDYKVNDLDVFILDKEPQNKPVLMSVQSKAVNLSEYWQIASPKLFMTGREETDGIDKVFMGLDYRYPASVIDFPSYVINSFDINCVEVGIYFDGTEFVLIWNDTFEEFLETRKVEITNVHSEVTYLRAVKKSRDLNATIDLKEEFEIVWYSCNSRYLNKLTVEQLAKHTPSLETLSEYKLGQVKEYFAVLKMSQPLHDEVYKSFFESRLMGNRRDKIKILRYFRNPNMTNWLCRPYPFEYPNVLYLASRYNGSLSEFFGKESASEMTWTYFRNVMGELDSHLDTHAEDPFIGMTLEECNTKLDEILA